MDRIKARIVTVTAGSIIAAMVLMIVYWVATNSLEQIETVIAAAVVSLLLGGVILLARRGRVRLAAWLLTGFLLVLIVLVSGGYGIGTPSIAGFLIPILLAALAIGPVAGYVTTGVSILIVWGLGAAAALGWIETWIPYQVSDLTFSAPFYTLLFLLVAAMVGASQKKE
jgi:hypothetical protein